MDHYLVTLETIEPDLLRRINLLNSALYRILSVSKLLRVRDSDYAAGRLSIEVEAPAEGPMISEGEVSENIQRLETGA